MKNLIITFIGILSINLVSAQTEKLDPSLQHIYDSINLVFDEVERKFTTWKTGYDNSHLKGLLKNIVDDSFARDLFRLDETVSFLHVQGFNTIDNRTTVSDWLNTLDAGLFPSYLFSMRYNYDGEIEHLWIFDLTGRMVREITIIWDDTYDGVNNVNLRTILDSYFNQ